MYGGTRTIPSESPVHTPVSIVQVVSSGNMTVVSDIIQRGFRTTISKLRHLGVVVMAIGVSCDFCINWTEKLHGMGAESLAGGRYHYGG